ncbi:hypothetical protein SAMN05421874_10348 [Nonomuraea maritima]|uniref:Uncharacterized protein n=1 Tax=Nonomuraea maritima TaxID=683260 RepID=A0A1G8W7S4_9ACTN|nr:hypothetical protein SAMN05421874_10348 [Nonomuraea maritima]
MATNISTQPDSPKAPWWAELRDWFISFFKGPSEREDTTQPPPPGLAQQSSVKAEDPMAEIKAALQRIEEALQSLPTPTPTPAPTVEHHVGTIFLAYLDTGRWCSMWAHKMLVEQEDTAREHEPGARLIAEKVAERYQAKYPDTAKTLRHWAQHGEPEPPATRPKRRRREGDAVS